MINRHCCNQTGSSRRLHPGTLRSHRSVTLTSCTSLVLSKWSGWLTSLLLFLCIAHGRQFIVLQSRSMTQFILVMSLHSRGSLFTLYSFCPLLRCCSSYTKRAVTRAGILNCFQLWWWDCIEMTRFFFFLLLNLYDLVHLQDGWLGLRVWSRF